MTIASQVLGYATAAGFLLLGLLTLRDWLFQRDPRRGFLALAIGLLAVVAVLGQLATAARPLQAVITPLSLVIFIAAGLALLLFRATFLPLRRAALVAAVAAATASVVALLAVGLPTGSQGLNRAQSVAIAAYVLVWIVLVGEPIVRFWMASIGRPGVQRARLRVLAAGYAGIVVVLAVSGFAGQAASSPSVQTLLQVIGLLTVPLLYASFAPPRWLRRMWREGEEEAFRRGTRDLLLFSPDRMTLARRSLDGALPLLGSDAGAIIDADQVLAIHGMDPDLAKELARHAEETTSDHLVQVQQAPNQNAIVIPLGVEKGRGAVIAISSAFMPLFGSDEVLRFEQFSVNLTLALDRVRVVERMAEVEHSKTQFLNLASHELRTPLSVIRGYLSILESGSLGTLNPAGRHAITVLAAKALEMNLLIEQMLEAARLEEGRLALRIERTDLARAAADAVELVRPLADDAHPLVLDLPEGDVAVLADRDRLSTILTNLLDNAIKYSPDGGAVHCAVSLDGGTASVAVRDHGVGVALADQATLFTRFGRITTDATRSIKGTGLGLYLARELARQMGGDITVESQAGSGSTFTVTFPAALPAESDATRASAPPTLRVLESTGTGQ